MIDAMLDLPESFFFVRSAPFFLLRYAGSQNLQVFALTAVPGKTYMLF